MRAGNIQGGLAGLDIGFRGSVSALTLSPYTCKKKEWPMLCSRSHILTLSPTKRNQSRFLDLQVSLHKMASSCRTSFAEEVGCGFWQSCFKARSLKFKHSSNLGPEAKMQQPRTVSKLWSGPYEADQSQVQSLRAAVPCMPRMWRTSPWTVGGCRSLGVAESG